LSAPPAIIPEITIALPGATNFQVSFRNVFDAYWVNDFGDNKEYFFVVDEQDGRVSFSEDINIWSDNGYDPDWNEDEIEEWLKGYPVKKGEWIGVDQIDLYFDEKGNLVGSGYYDGHSTVNVTIRYNGYFGDDDDLSDPKGSIQQFAVK
jgi:hypothetical protein